MSLLNKIWHIEYNTTITEQKYELLKINCVLLNIATIRQPYSFAALTREISSWTLEDKIHIHAQACNILYL